MGCSTFSKLKPTSPTPVSHQGVEIKDSQLVISTRDVRLIVDGSEIGIGVAKCVGRACNRACWTSVNPRLGFPSQHGRIRSKPLPRYHRVIGCAVMNG